MQAVLMTEPSATADRTVVGELPEPEPTTSQVAINVEYAGINFIDVMARRGDPGYALTWPYTPGHEVAGTVRALGSGVTGLTVGQRVAAFTRDGGFAEVAVAEADLVVPIPDGLDMRIAAASPLMLASAYLLLTDVTRMQPGETVLMHAASGGLGSAIAQLIPLLGGGLRIGTVGRADKVADAKRLGWDVAIVRDDRLASAVLDVASGGVDVILDASGTTLLDVDLAVAAPGARIALFGNAGGGAPEALPPLASLIGGNVTLAGFSVRRMSATAPGRVAAALRDVFALLADGRLTVPVTEVDSLHDVAAVHDLVADGRGSGKYVARVKAA